MVFSVGSFVGNVRSVENKDGKLVVCIDVSAELSSVIVRDVNTNLLTSESRLKDVWGVFISF